VNVDLYTKGVLTVIAGALIFLCLQRDVKDVHAQAVQPVFIQGIDPSVKLPIDTKGVATLPVVLLGTHYNGDPSHPYDFSTPIQVTARSPIPVVNKPQ
jgi:hypothetical protein